MAIGSWNEIAVPSGRRPALQIAEQAYLSELTAKNHVSTIQSKLEIARRTEAAAYLLRHSGLSP